MRKAISLLALFLLCALPAVVSAQNGLTQQCATIANEPTRRFCNLVVEAIEIGQPRAGLALVGGNPVPGMASTLGMRTGKVPRFAGDVRVTAVKIDLPPIRRIGSTDDIESVVPSINLDATVGIVDGISLFPTVGGFGSIDLVASVGFIPLPKGDGFNRNPISWGVGARLGLLRESFTAPGITLSALYRHVGDVDYGDRQLQQQQSFFTASGVSALSLRGVIGKRLLSLGVSAGFGWDRYSSDIEFGVADAALLGGNRFTFTEDDFHTNRGTFFGGLQYTLLVLSFNAEFGFQTGGDDFSAQLPVGQSSTSQNKALFATLAFRVTI